MRIAILDPAAGISGDMTLGALLALGVPQDWLEALPGRLGLGGVGVTGRDTVRSGVACYQVGFTLPQRTQWRHWEKPARRSPSATLITLENTAPKRAIQLVWRT